MVIYKEKDNKVKMVVYTDYSDLYEIYGWMALSMSFIVLYGKLRSFFPHWKDPLMTDLGFYNLDICLVFI